MTFEELEKEANGDAGRGLVLALLEIAASIRDASENIALALDGIAEGALQRKRRSNATQAKPARRWPRSWRTRKRSCGRDIRGGSHEPRNPSPRHRRG